MTVAKRRFRPVGVFLLVISGSFVVNGISPALAGTADSIGNGAGIARPGVVTNINPDPLGPPWLVGGYEPLPAGIRRKGRADKTLWQSMP